MFSNIKLIINNFFLLFYNRATVLPEAVDCKIKFPSVSTLFHLPKMDLQVHIKQKQTLQCKKH